MAGEQSIALNRFGLGARPDDKVGSDPRGWVAAQLGRFQPAPLPIASQPSQGELLAMFRDYREEAGAARRARREMTSETQAPASGMAMEEPARADDPLREVPQMLRRGLREAYAGATNARLESALQTDAPFPERLVHFWANHFAVSADKIAVIPVAGNYEFTAIRPNVMGSFADLLSAAVLHPAMLLYLDQAQSVGPGSTLAQRAGRRAERRPEGMGRKLGLNENLGREILELHTLGVRTGYSQADVTELARALTGWTIAGQGQGRMARVVPGTPGDIVFAEALHEPGARTILGKTYPEGGGEQAKAMLADLARRPATARHIATKLARHFIADNPPPSAITRIEQAYITSDGDLPTIYRALITSPEVWAAETVKFRNPWDWTVASLRATGLKQLPDRQAAAGLLQQLGQPIWRPGSPAGWGDTAPDWAGPGALMTRVEVAQQLASRIGDAVDARQLAASVLPDAAEETRQAIARSESPAMGLALMLSSPEFLRR